jgi:hypothetical protein
MIEADGDRWRVRLGNDRPRPGVRVVLFFCETTDQRPYRVVEVSEERFRTQADVEGLSSEETLELYRGSVSLDYPHFRSDELGPVKSRRDDSPS